MTMNLHYSYDRRAAGRVTFTPFGRLDSEGGRPAKILLDGVRLGEVERAVEMHSVGVQQKVFTVAAYVPYFQGPIMDLPTIAAIDEKRFQQLPELKRVLASILGRIPAGVSEAYQLYWDKKISIQEWHERCKALL